MYALRRYAPQVLLPSLAAALAASTTALDRSQCQDDEASSAELIFIGTGSSSGCPRPLCPMVFSRNNDPQLLKLQKQMAAECKVSNLAIQGDPKTNKNYRNNPSVVLKFLDEHGNARHIIIDTGKTFREASLRWFPELGVTSLDAVILTHEHADASFGLDDVRGYQRRKGHYSKGKVPIPVYLSQHCLTQVASQFTWLFPNHQPENNKQVDDGKPVVVRNVAALDVHVIEAFQPVNIVGIEVVPLPVMHGEDLVSFGYAFTLGSKHVVYISDVSRILPETLEFIRNRLPPTDIFVIDTLDPTYQSEVHYNLDQAITLRDRLAADNPDMETFIVGINCDRFPPHEQANKELQRKYGKVQFAYDGQVLKC